MRKIHLSALLLTLLLTQCSRVPEWLPGTYQLDTETVAKPIKELIDHSSQPAEGESKAGNVISALAQTIGTGALMAEFRDKEIIITQDEVRIMKNGAGQANHYEVIDVPDDQSVIIKLDDGSLKTLHRTETGVAVSLSGNADMDVYLKRVTP